MSHWQGHAESDKVGRAAAKLQADAKAKADRLEADISAAAVRRNANVRRTSLDLSSALGSTS